MEATVPGQTDFPTSLSELVSRHAKDHPTAIAVRSGDDVISYAELAQRCEQFAGHLVDRGVAGGVVAVSVPPWLITSRFGLTISGRVTCRRAKVSN